MRVRVSYTVEVSDELRREINAYYGKPGLASRDEVKQWYENYGDSMDMNLLHYGGTAAAEREGEDDG